MEQKEAAGKFVIVDCAFESARRSFADFCGFGQVSLECMLRCEDTYEKLRQRNGKEKLEEKII